MASLRARIFFCGKRNPIVPRVPLLVLYPHPSVCILSALRVPCPVKQHCSPPLTHLGRRHNVHAPADLCLFRQHLSLVPLQQPESRHSSCQNAYAFGAMHFGHRILQHNAYAFWANIFLHYPVLNLQMHMHFMDFCGIMHMHSGHNTFLYPGTAPKKI